MENEIVWSIDEESFTLSSKDEAIDSLFCDNPQDLMGRVIYFGTSHAPDVSSLVDASDIIEMLGERAYDNYGEWAETFPDLSKNDIKDKAAIDALNAYLSSWITENCPVTFWSVENVEKYIITQEDVDEYFQHCERKAMCQ